LGRFGERQDLVDDGNGTARLDELVDGFEVRRRSHRRTEGRQRLPPDAMEVRGRVRPGRRATDAYSPRRPRRIERALPRCLADVIDHDVGAAAGELLNLGDDFVGAMVEGTVRSELAGSLQLLGARRGDDHPCPERLAIASVAVDTPLPIPQASTHSPSCSPALVTSMR